MQCLRSNKKRALFYDEKHKHFIKVFTPKFKLKLKYWFKLRTYPGINFAHIAKRFAALGITTPRVVYADKYTVVTEKFDAPTLGDYLARNSDPSVMPRFAELIASILNSGILYFDFNLGNFLYKNNQFIALDLEDYRDTIFVSRGRKGVLFRIEKYHGKQFAELVNSLWKEPTKLQHLTHDANLDVLKSTY